MVLLSILLYIIIGCLCAYAYEHFYPGAIPGGLKTGAIVGSLGAFLGSFLHLGPEMAGVFLVPCVLGAALFTFAATYVQKTIKHNES